MDKVHTTRLGVNVPSIAALRSVMEISEYQCTLDATGMPSGYQIFYSRKREIHTANSIWTLSTGKVVISMVGHDGSTNRSGCNMESDRRFEFRPPPPNWSAMRQGINRKNPFTSNNHVLFTSTSIATTNAAQSGSIPTSMGTKGPLLY